MPGVRCRREVPPTTGGSPKSLLRESTESPRRTGPNSPERRNSRIETLAVGAIDMMRGNASSVSGASCGLSRLASKGSSSGFPSCQQRFIAFSSMNIEPGKTARRLGTLVPNPNARLRDQFHEVCRFKYFSPRTEDSYWQWVVRFLKFHRKPIGMAKEATPHPQSLSPVEAERETRPGAHGVSPPTQGGWRHPKELGAPEVAAFLSDLANRQG
jgi:hypothetical protein